MDFVELKSLAKRLGGILVVNGNTPEFVILSFEDFQKMQTVKNHTDSADLGGDEGVAIEKLNKEILALKEEIRQKEENELLEEEEDNDKEKAGEEMAT